MQRPWVQPAEVKEYSESAKVAARSNVRLAYDIARAERCVIYHTHNRFDTEEYEKELPQDVRMAVILLAEAYAKQAITQKEGAKSSETFDDYSYTMDNDSDIAENLGLALMLDDYIIQPDNGKVTMKLRKL